MYSAACHGIGPSFRQMLRAASLQLVARFRAITPISKALPTAAASAPSARPSKARFATSGPWSAGSLRCAPPYFSRNATRCSPPSTSTDSLVQLTIASGLE